MKFIKELFFLIWLVCLSISINAQTDTTMYKVSVMKYLMGTTVETTARTRDVNLCKQAFISEYTEMQRIENLLSCEKDSSEISAINRASGYHPVKVSEETLEMVKRAQAYCKKYNGVFDITATSLQNKGGYNSIVLNNKETPKSAAIIHCVGRDEVGYCSSVCCMYSLKFNHYLKSKIPDIEIYEFYKDLCIPGKSHQKFYEQIREKGTKLIRFDDINIVKNGKKININYNNQNNKGISIDMVILASSIKPKDGASDLAKSLDISMDKYGFFKERDSDILSISSSKDGIYITGCSQGPKNIQESISQADAAVGKILKG